MSAATGIWLRRSAILTTLLVAGERLWTLVHAPPTYFDDAYMFLRYAHNLLDGYGLRWNRGEPPVYGATSLPHVLVVALVRWAGPALSDAAVLQISSGVARGAARRRAGADLRAVRAAPVAAPPGLVLGRAAGVAARVYRAVSVSRAERDGHHAGGAGQHRS